MKVSKHNQQERFTQHNKQNDLSDAADRLPTFYEEQHIADTGLVEELTAEQWVAIDENPLNGLLGSEFQDHFWLCLMKSWRKLMIRLIPMP